MDNDLILRSKLNAAAGLLALKENRFKIAARKFIEVGIEMDGKFSNVLTAQDISIYGTLCAVAFLERPELNKAFLEVFICFIYLN